MVKKILLVAILAGISTAGFAQSQLEALRFSRSTHLGTARFSAMGGAFAALGGDPTTLAFNPAGIGVYRSNEFTFTGDLSHTGTQTSYMGNTAKDYRYSFGFSNIAAIGVYNTHNSEGLVTFNFGFAYNKNDKFHQRYLVNGSYQDKNTYLDYFAQLGTNDGNEPEYLNNDEAWMGFETWLIDTVNAGTAYDYFPLLREGDQTQGRQYAEIEGYLASYDFTLGANISNVFYLGMGVGISSVRYYETNISSEYAKSSNTPGFRNFDYTKTYGQTGTGYNFKFGIIAWPFANADFLNGLKVGGAVHTRTFLSMSNEYKAGITSMHSDKGGYEAAIDPNEFSYKIETPLRVMGGLAYVFSPATYNGLRGILSADYEYVDYSSIMMREASGYAANDPSDPHFNESNANIASMYRGTHNLRLGGELGYQKMAFRLGYAYYDNPYTSKKNGAVNIFSGGLGWQSSSFGINFTYSLSIQKDRQYMYYCEEADGAPGADIISDEQLHTMNKSNFFLTLGWRF